MCLFCLRSWNKKHQQEFFCQTPLVRERPQQGRVMAVGESEKIKVTVNQKVIFNRYGGTEVKIGAEEYLLVASKDILAVISLD
jgi:co-chaperonin GroES (HSP10)